MSHSFLAHVNFGICPVIGKDIVFERRRFFEEKRCAVENSIKWLPVVSGCSGTARDEQSPCSEVIEAVDAKTHVLQGLYKIIIAFARGV